MPSKQWIREYKRQREEHPSLPNYVIARITSDHMALRAKSRTRRM